MNPAERMADKAVRSAQLRNCNQAILSHMRYAVP